MTNKSVRSSLQLLLLVLTVMVLYNAILTSSYTADPNYANVTIDTRVNITNAPPEVLSVIITENVGAQNLTLLAGRNRTVYCNATIRDWNGYGDINITNATFWDNNVATQNDPSNNRTVYRTNCTNITNDGQYLSYWQCVFDVWYFANNGTDWRCNVTTVDNSTFNASNYNITSIDPLYALNITGSELDYGNVPVEGTSVNLTANVTNFGNQMINVSVFGYAQTVGDNLAMNCSINGNISIGYQRYSLDPTIDWANKKNLTSVRNNINLTVNRSINHTAVTNTTYWQLYIPVENNPAGICTGNLVFEASPA